MKNGLLKILAALSFAAVGFPLLFGCDTNRYGNISIARLLFYFAVSAAVFGAGCLLTSFAENVGIKGKRMRKALKIAVRAVGAMSFFAGFLALLIKGDAATVFALGFCCVLCFFIGERFVYKNFTDLFPLSAFGFYIVFTIGCYVFVRAAVPEDINETVSDIVTAAFSFEFIAAALLINQSGISQRANMRRETKTSLPEGLIGYNAAMILTVCAVGLMFTGLRKQIAWLLEQIMLLVLRGVIAFASLFDAERMAIDQGESDTSFEGFIEMRQSYIWQAFGIIALAVLIFVFRKQIISAVKELFTRLGQFLAGRPEGSETPEFTDIFENIPKSRRKRERPASPYAIAAAYRTESDPVKKFRLGYRLLLYRIRSYNHTLTEADTTSVQAEKGGKYLGEEELRRIAGYYDGIRYGGNTAMKEQLAELDGLLEGKNTKGALK